MWSDSEEEGWGEGGAVVGVEGGLVEPEGSESAGKTTSIRQFEFG